MKRLNSIISHGLNQNTLCVSGSAGGNTWYDCKTDDSRKIVSPKLLKLRFAEEGEKEAIL